MLWNPYRDPHILAWQGALGSLLAMLLVVLVVILVVLWLIIGREE